MGFQRYSLGAREVPLLTPEQEVDMSLQMRDCSQRLWFILLRYATPRKALFTILSAQEDPPPFMRAFGNLHKLKKPEKHKRNENKEREKISR